MPCSSTSSSINKKVTCSRFIGGGFQPQMAGCKDGYQKIMLTTNSLMREKLSAGLASADAQQKEVLPKCSNLSFPSSVFICNETSKNAAQHIES